MLITNTAFSLVLSKLSLHLRPLFNWLVHITVSCLYLYLPHFSLINAFSLNCRWVNLSDIYWSIHFDNSLQFSLFYYLTMCSNISSLSAIYRTYNSTVFKCIAGTLFAIICLYISILWSIWSIQMGNCVFLPFDIPCISRMLIRIWESQFSSVSSQFVIWEDIFNIVVYGEISSELHSSVIEFAL